MRAQKGAGSPLSHQTRQAIRDFYDTLWNAFGPQNWWPAESPFEVIVGAYLTQNTTWTNVEKALANLRARKLLSLDAMREARIRQLESCIRPVGYFRQKARALKTLIKFLDERYHGSLDEMFAQPTAQLRAELLELKGVGPETADSILLYAGQHEVFVIDAYTRRVVERHGLAQASSSYEAIQAVFESALQAKIGGSLSTPTEANGSAHAPSRMSRYARSQKAQMFNEMHAFLVVVGKHHCRKKTPNCQGCPLKKFLPA